MNWNQALMLPLVAVLFTVGCGPTADETTQTNEETTELESSEAHVHTHNEWWCVEHGVPEEQCGQCSAKLAAEFQKNGDWCKEHDRPDSQCFICHPELETKFAALFEAKYGKEPPKPTE
ncbi:MAG: hypothetical protein R3C18_21260 [Planctomycetaceae bacterium]